MKPLLTALLLTVLFAFTACQSNPQSLDETAVNADVGSPVASTTTSAPMATAVPSSKKTNKLQLIPPTGFTGRRFSPMLNDDDLRMENEAENRATLAPVGQKVSWNNSQDGNSGTIMVVKDGYDATGAYCREFRHSFSLDGTQQQDTSKACQQTNGSWKSAP